MMDYSNVTEWPIYACLSCKVIWKGRWISNATYHPKKCPHCKSIYFKWLNPNV